MPNIFKGGNMYVNIKKKHKGYQLKHERLRIGLSQKEANKLITVLVCGNAWLQSQKRQHDFGRLFLDKLTEKWVELDPKSQY